MVRERMKNSLKIDKLTDIGTLQNMVEKQVGNSHKKLQVSGRRNDSRREGELNIVS